MTDLVDFVALSLLPPRYGVLVAEQLHDGHSAGAVLSRFAPCVARDEPDSTSAFRAEAADAIRRAQVEGLTPIAWNDSAYPPALTTIADPPMVLWVRGHVATLAAPAVAIVGSRAASSYGLAVAERLAGDLAACGLVIVSGMARGVDSAAHRGALAASGVTVAVLGSGVDVIYPPEHASLARDIATTGAVASELVPGTAPLPLFFPRRNRIISGLSRAVVVIEASDKSGSLITARCALEQGRDVLAVPGNVLSGRNRGAHALLRDGARIVESADDILDELGMRTGGPHADVPAAQQASPSVAHPDPVLDALLPGEGCALDAIAERTGLDSRRLLPRLFELELQGLVRREGGGRFVQELTERVRVNIGLWRKPL